jgi:hypothetical protein
MFAENGNSSSRNARMIFSTGHGAHRSGIIPILIHLCVSPLVFLTEKRTSFSLRAAQFQMEYRVTGRSRLEQKLPYNKVHFVVNSKLISLSPAITSFCRFDLVLYFSGTNSGMPRGMSPVEIRTVCNPTAAPLISRM